MTARAPTEAHEQRTVVLVIEGPPPRKNAKHSVFATRRKNGKVAIGRKCTEAFTEFCGRMAAAWRDLRAQPFGDSPVCVGIVAYWSSKRRADVDAPIECVLDALTKAGVWNDDVQVVSLHAAKAYSKERPRVEVEIGWPAVGGTQGEGR